MSTSRDSLGGASKSAAIDARTLEIVAIFCSVVGLVFAPALLAGLICGVFALAKGARTLAVVAMVVSILGVALWVLITALMIVPAIRDSMDGSMGGAGGGSGSPASAGFGTPLALEVRMTSVAAGEVAVSVQNFEFERGRLPNDFDEVLGFVDPRIARGYRDAWSRPFRLRREALRDANGTPTKAEVTFVWSAGPDRIWDTADDFVAGSHPNVIVSEYGLPDSPGAPRMEQDGSEN